MFNYCERIIEPVLTNYKGKKQGEVADEMIKIYNDIDKSLAKLIREGADSDSLYIENIIEDCNKLREIAIKSGFKM